MDNIWQMLLLVLVYLAGFALLDYLRNRRRKNEREIKMAYQWECPVNDCGFMIKCQTQDALTSIIGNHYRYAHRFSHPEVTD